MNIWLDANISPQIANWINNNFNLKAMQIRELGLSKSSDLDIFNLAKSQNIIFVTKDKDFIRLLELNGSPPKIILLTCGNTSNKNLKEILFKTLQKALDLFTKGEDLVEIAM